jgi:hypothetical protein
MVGIPVGEMWCDYDLLTWRSVVERHKSNHFLNRDCKNLNLERVWCVHKHFSRRRRLIKLANVVIIAQHLRNLYAYSTFTIYEW